MHSLVFHAGRRVDGQWILGMIEINTGDVKRRGGRFRLEICEDNKRDHNTLSNLIRKHVKPGTTLVTDEWRGYCGIEGYNYEHYTVTHDTSFVDQKTGANTQTIESQWRSMRRRLDRGGIPKDELASHMCEFLWRRYCYINEMDPFMKFIEDSARTYDPKHPPTPQTESEQSH